MSERPHGFQTFFAELKRRQVSKVAAVYGAVTLVVHLTWIYMRLSKRDQAIEKLEQLLSIP